MKVVSATFLFGSPCTEVLTPMEPLAAAERDASGSLETLQKDFEAAKDQVQMCQEKEAMLEKEIAEYRRQMAELKKDIEEAERRKAAEPQHGGAVEECLNEQGWTPAADQDAVAVAVGMGAGGPEPSGARDGELKINESKIYAEDVAVYYARRNKEEHVKQLKEVPEGWGKPDKWGELKWDPNPERKAWREWWQGELQILECRIEEAVEKKRIELAEAKRRLHEAHNPSLKRARISQEEEDDALRAAYYKATYSSDNTRTFPQRVYDLDTCTYCQRYIEPYYFYPETRQCKLCKDHLGFELEDSD